MGSNLLAIYDALALVQVPVNGVIVPVKNVTGLPATVASGDVPIRLLMPLGTRPGSNAVSEITLMGMASSDWRITDMLLLKPAQAGKLDDVAPLMVRYMADYATALMRTRALAGAPIVGFSMDAGVGPYPEGTQWYGVNVTLTVKETWR